MANNGPLVKWYSQALHNFLFFNLVFIFKADTPIEEFTPTPAFPALQYLESVDEGGVAWQAGLRTGDFLIEVGDPEIWFSALCWGNSDVPSVEFTSEKVCDASEQQAQWTNTNNVLHLIRFKISHSIWESSLKEQCSGWLGIFCLFFLLFGNTLSEKFGRFYSSLHYWIEG